jgi:hypothetical protein
LTCCNVTVVLLIRGFQRSIAACTHIQYLLEPNTIAAYLSLWHSSDVCTRNKRRQVGTLGYISPTSSGAFGSVELRLYYSHVRDDHFSSVNDCLGCDGAGYEDPPLFVNSDVLVNIARLHTHVPHVCSSYDSHQHWWCVRFKRSSALLSVQTLFTSLCDVHTHLGVYKHPWPCFTLFYHVLLYVFLVFTNTHGHMQVPVCSHSRVPRGGSVVGVHSEAGQPRLVRALATACSLLRVVAYSPLLVTACCCLSLLVNGNSCA